MDDVAVCPGCGQRLPAGWAWLSPYRRRRYRRCGREIQRQSDGIAHETAINLSVLVLLLVVAVWFLGALGFLLGYTVAAGLMFVLWPYTARYELIRPDHATCRTAATTSQATSAAYARSVARR